MYHIFLNWGWITILGAVLISSVFFLSRVLPGERWQFFFVVPFRKKTSGEWDGINFTYYGLISSFSSVFALALFFLMMFSAGNGFAASTTVISLVLAVSFPCAKILAYIIERKKHTISVGAAVFSGFFALSLSLFIFNSFLAKYLGGEMGVIPAFAAASVSYLFGEGIGRLSCISFGCCYGKPLDQAGITGRTLFKSFNFVFKGSTKKISYCAGLEGVPVVPVQAVTSIVFIIAGTAGLYLFFHGFFSAAFITGAVFSQLWRIFSETFRADYRGGKKISVYQIMAGVVVFYSAALSMVFSGAHHMLPDAEAGFRMMWDPLIIIMLQILWLLFFIYTGKSMVTGSRITLFVHRERI